MPARYPVRMTEREVDRGEWSKIVQELIDERTKGKKEPFARLVGVYARTLSHWLDSTVAVSESSVRQVADRTGRNAIAMLIRVGYYTLTEVIDAVRLLQRTDDPAMQVIARADLPEDVKARIRARLDRRRAAQAAAEADEVRGWLDEAEGA
jgi:hypothetical protein